MTLHIDKRIDPAESLGAPPLEVLIQNVYVGLPGGHLKRLSQVILRHRHVWELL